MNEPKYIQFIEHGVSPSGKTKIWQITSKDDFNDFLGWIKWDGAWRCYSFYPTSNVDGGLVFEKQCLRDIADFCEKQTKLHKPKTKDVFQHGTCDEMKGRTLKRIEEKHRVNIKCYTGYLPDDPHKGMVR
jgi:hypothetical protein